MASYFSKKEIEEMKPNVDKTVEKVVGFSEPSLVTTTMNCLLSGYDKKKTGGKNDVITYGITVVDIIIINLYILSKCFFD